MFLVWKPLWTLNFACAHVNLALLEESARKGSGCPYIWKPFYFLFCTLLFSHSIGKEKYGSQFMSEDIGER